MFEEMSNFSVGYLFVSAIVVYILSFVISENKSAGTQYGFSIMPLISSCLAGITALSALPFLLFCGGFGIMVHALCVGTLFKKLGHQL